MGRISFAQKVVYLLTTTSIRHDDVHRKRSKYYRELFTNYRKKEMARNINMTTRKHFWEILRDNRITIDGKKNGLGVRRLRPLLDYYKISYNIEYYEDFNHNVIRIDLERTLRYYKIKDIQKNIKKLSK